MKFLPLSIFILSIIHVNSQCLDFIRRYNQCKTNMDKELSDKFFENLVSEEMNFDKAMDLFRTIYTETYNCTSDFCRCAKVKINDKKGNYSVFFRQKDLFPHVKNIIESFIKKFKPILLPYDKVMFISIRQANALRFHQGKEFCIKYDYSKNRLDFYKYKFTCSSLSSKGNVFIYTIFISLESFVLTLFYSS